MRKLLFALLCSTVLLAIPGTAFAQQAQFNKQERAILAKDQTVTGDYFTAGEKVSVYGTVTGDVYAAGGTVTIDGDVQGDVIAAGGNVTVGGTVAGNVRVAGGQVTIASQIGKNLTTMGGNVTIAKDATVSGSLVSGVGTILVYGPIAKGLTMGGGQATIDAPVTGDVNAGIGQLTLGPNAAVDGNLTYMSEDKAQIEQGATVSGQIVKHNPPVDERQGEEVAKGLAAFLLGFFVIWKLANVLTTLLLGFLLVWLAPRYLERTAALASDNPWVAIGLGIATIILAPVLMIVLAITIIGIPLAFLLFLLFCLLVIFGKVVALYIFGRRVLGALGRPESTYLAFLAGVLLFEVVLFIPVLGLVAKCLVYSFGIGALLLAKRYYYREMTR